jgi:hypothetical protein
MADPTSQALKPRLCRGATVIETKDSIIVEGTPRRQRIRTSADGGSAGLFKLLDDHHDNESICTSLGLDPEDLRKSLGRLTACGVLEWTGPMTPSCAFPKRHVMDYYSRNISLSSEHGCAESLAVALASAAVILIGDVTFNALLSADLAEDGVVTVLSLSGPDELKAAINSEMIPAHARRIAVASDPAMSPNQLEEVVRHCGAENIPVLRYAWDTCGCEIGPVFLPGSTACIDCLRGGDDSLSRGYPEDGRVVSYLEHQSMTGLLAGLLSTDILALVGHAQQSRKWHELTRVDLKYNMLTYEVVPDTQCACGPGLAIPPDTRDISAYEWLQADRPGIPPWRRPAAEGPRRKTGSARKRRDLHTSPRRRLDDEPAAVGEAASEPTADESDQQAGGVQPLTSSSLGYLLSHVADARGWANWDGVAEERSPTQDPVPQECPPLTDLYVLMRADLLGLHEESFIYDDATHEAIAIRPDFVSIDQLIPETDASIALVMVGAFRRMRAEYGDLTPRLAYLDAGSALLNLIVAANRLGWKVSHVPSWNELVAEALNLDPSSQPITLIAGISIPGNEFRS